MGRRQNRSSYGCLVIILLIVGFVLQMEAKIAAACFLAFLPLAYIDLFSGTAVRRSRLSQSTKRESTYTLRAMLEAEGRNIEVCEVCGQGSVRPDIHHIVPLSEGGTNDPLNLEVVCPNCHRRRQSGRSVAQVRTPAKWRRYVYASLIIIAVVDLCRPRGEVRLKPLRSYSPLVNRRVNAPPHGTRALPDSTQWIGEGQTAYESLEVGMTRGEADELLGIESRKRGTLSVPSGKRATLYEWRLDGGTVVKGEFVDGLAVRWKMRSLNGDSHLLPLSGADQLETNRWLSTFNTKRSPTPRGQYAP